MRTVAKGDDLRGTADAEGLSIEIRRLDVCDPASVAEGIGDPAELDVVVNNAGFEVAGALDWSTTSRGRANSTRTCSVPCAWCAPCCLHESVKSSMPFEEFETVMRDTLDWHE